MTPMPNHLSTRLTTHLLMSGGVWGTHSKNKKATQNSVEKVAMWRRGEGWLEMRIRLSS